MPKKKVAKKVVKKGEDCVCLKCSEKYLSNDVSDIEGDGYCPSCTEEKKAIASEVDKKFANRPAPKLKINFESLPRVPGTTYISARQLFGW